MFSSTVQSVHYSLFRLITTKLNYLAFKRVDLLVKINFLAYLEEDFYGDHFIKHVSLIDVCVNFNVAVIITLI